MHSNDTKVISKIIEWKAQKIVVFFTCILPDYMTHDTPKEFWKKYQFWKYDSWFSSEVSKFTSANSS